MRKTIRGVLVAALLVVSLTGLLSAGSANALVRCQPSPTLEICIDFASGEGIVIGASGTEGVIEISVLRGEALVTGLQAVNVNGTEIAVLLACDGDTILLYINPRGQFGEGILADTMIPCPPIR